MEYKHKKFYHCCMLCVAIMMYMLTNFSSLLAAEIEPTEKPYQVIIENRGENTKKSLLKLYSRLQQKLEQRGVSDNISDEHLYYRFEQDHAYLQKMLKASGYYKADIGADFDAEHARATFRIQSGVRYQFGQVKIIQAKANVHVDLPKNEMLKVKPAHPIRNSFVFSDEKTIDDWIEKKYCFFRHTTNHQAVVDHINHTVNISYYIDVSEQTSFGEVSFKGQETITDSYLEKIVNIKKDECFKRSKLNAAKLALQKTGLLSEVNIILPESPSPDKHIDISFDIAESLHRSIKTGLNYNTDVGFGFINSWEHRNFLSHGEKFSVLLSLAANERDLSTQLEKPFFRRDNQQLTLGNSITWEDNEAFHSKELSVSAGIKRNLSHQWIIGLGTTYGVTQVKDNHITNNIALLSLNGYATQDTRNDILNPTEGWTLQFFTEPSIDTSNTETAFLKTQVGGSYYHAISDRTVLASRVSAGGIAGVSTNDAIPATERFYAGGTGSIRGYGYQLAGSLDADNTPIGGRSFFEFSTELRVRVAEDYGAVAFIDGGNVFDSSLPNFKESLFFGVGVGVRYYSSFGPLRADIALPLDKRNNIDNAFHLYFSIGQAF